MLARITFASLPVTHTQQIPSPDVLFIPAVTAIIHYAIELSTFSPLGTTNTNEIRTYYRDSKAVKHDG